MTNNCNYEGYHKLKKDMVDIECFYSQAGQDLLVLQILDYKKNGIFIEIGANHFSFLSNTYLLESKFDWRGISIEMDKSFEVDFRKNRKSTLLSCDATEINYKNLIMENELSEIDYLSVDIDGWNSLVCIRKILESDCLPKIITFEHDAYRFDKKIRDISREIINEKGYLLLCSDVKDNNNAFEDWYILPELLTEENKVFLSSDESWKKIIFNNYE